MITFLGFIRGPFFSVILLSALKCYANDNPAAAEQLTNNEELVIIFQEDQADRQPKDGQIMEGSMMRERDMRRQARVMEIYQTDGLKTGQDYFYAAYVMQHGGSTESFLLAHEFSMASLALGYSRARWIAAASYDRLLKSIGRPQRFGTQYSTLGGAGMNLYQTEDGVRDSLRTVLKVPSLDSAKAREADIAKQFPPSTKPIFSLAKFAPNRPPPAEFDVLDLKSGDIAPEPLNQPLPEYPSSLLPKNLVGSVFVNAVIERDGTASNIKIVMSSNEAFGAAAETAFRLWTFKPGVKQGRPARVIVIVQFNFAPPAAK